MGNRPSASSKGRGVQDIKMKLTFNRIEKKRLSNKVDDTVVKSKSYAPLAATSTNHEIQMHLPSHRDSSIPPLVYHIIDSLCGLVIELRWKKREEKSDAPDIDEILARIIYDFARAEVVELPPSETNETVFSIGVRSSGKVIVSGFTNRQIPLSRGIRDGLYIWDDLKYKFKGIRSTRSLKRINKYFLSSYKGNGKGTAPNIRFENPSICDAVYLFLEPNTGRDGGWGGKIPGDGWKWLGNIRWDQQQDTLDIWKHSVWKDGEERFF